MSALISLQCVSRRYEQPGAPPVWALREVDLEIGAGEMVAIVGPSGCGKSTLLNLIGALDGADEGSVVIDGADLATLDAAAAARLRREHIGFVFQHHHLIEQLDARANVELPAIYGGAPPPQRRRHADRLLERFGLADRCAHKPAQLSGGQRQRVAIARALMNGGRIVLADEPTGALDSANGQQTVTLLRELCAHGHTVVIVTHDPAIAAQAPRVVEMRDGRIVRDSGALAGVATPRAAPAAAGSSHTRAVPLLHALRMALVALLSHRLRSALSVLGVCIGIFAVVSIVAISQAAQATVDSRLRSFLSGRVTLMRDAGDSPGGNGSKAFNAGDIEALRAVPGIAGVTNARETLLAVRHAERSGALTVIAAEPGDLAEHRLTLVEGRDLSALERNRAAQVIVIDRATRTKLFDRFGQAVGRSVLVGELSFEVIGVATNGGGPLGGNGWRDRGFIPTTTYAAVLGAAGDAEQLSLRVAPGFTAADVTALAGTLLQVRHRARDFRFISLDEELRRILEISDLIALVLASIAGISLAVGGVGVMNIMLVAVAERKREIGIRLAIGARQVDIERQFLLEAMVLSTIGGCVGVLACGVVALAANALQSEITVVLAWSSLVTALGVAVAVGAASGYWPARQAARLSPWRALQTE